MDYTGEYSRTNLGLIRIDIDNDDVNDDDDPPTYALI